MTIKTTSLTPALAPGSTAFTLPFLPSTFNPMTELIPSTAAIWTTEAKVNATGGSNCQLSAHVLSNGNSDGVSVVLDNKESFNVLSSMAILAPSAVGFFGTPVGQVTFVPSSGAAIEIVAVYLITPILVETVVTIGTSTGGTQPELTPATFVETFSGRYSVVLTAFDHRVTCNGRYEAHFGTLLPSTTFPTGYPTNIQAPPTAPSSAVFILPAQLTVNVLDDDNSTSGCASSSSSYCDDDNKSCSSRGSSSSSSSCGSSSSRRSR